MMKKIIILAIVVLIPVLIAINSDATKTLKEKVEKGGYVIKPKDSLWEFVKNETRYGRINLDIDYQKLYKEPILFSLENATKRDSLMIKKMMDELKLIFTKKKIQYYSDFTGEEYIPFEGKWIPSFKETSDELYSCNNLIVFDNSIKGAGSTSRSFDLNKVTDLKFTKRKNKWNYFVFENKIKVHIPEDVNQIKGVYFIKNFFLETYWETKNTNPENANPDFRRAKSSISMYLKNYKKRYDSFYINDYEFLFQKLFSEDFKEQFTTYMYKTYPWQYASVFLDKEKSRKNANVIVIVFGILLLIFSTSIFWTKKAAFTFYDYFFCVFVFFVGFGSLNTLYSFVFQIDVLNSSVYESLKIILISILICLFISFVAWKIEKQMNRKISQFGFRLFLKTVFTFSILYLPYFFILLLEDLLSDGKSITVKPATDIQYFSLVIGLALVRTLIIYLNNYAESQLKEKDVELSRLKEINAQSELKLLQSHINPHFLYNALNSIAGLAHTNANKTEKMALSLSDLFRYSINKKGKKMSTIHEEMEMVQNYMEIEKIRFGERLQFSLAINEDLKDEKIPMYILQPLVENAIKHGISKIAGNAKISIEIKKEQQQLLIVIGDNGPNFPERLVSGHGLQTVYDLLRLSYGEKASLTWENEPKKQIMVSITQNLQHE